MNTHYLLYYLNIIDLKEGEAGSAIIAHIKIPNYNEKKKKY